MKKTGPIRKPAGPMKKAEFGAALRALGLTQQQAAEQLGVSEGWISRLLNEKDAKQVSRRIADKVKRMNAAIPLFQAWERCPRCGGVIRLLPSKNGSGGAAVIHRCPAVDGVIVKTTIEPMGVTAEQAKAALGRRPGKQNGGGK